MESSTYSHSKDEEKHEQNSIHSNTKKWHYFKKDFIVDDKLYTMLIDVRESIEHKTYIHKIRLEDKKFNFEHEKMATPTIRLATNSICGRLPFDVSDDTTNEVVNQEEDIEF